MEEESAVITRISNSFVSILFVFVSSLCTPKQIGVASIKSYVNVKQASGYGAYG
jgi:hypothetical protein